MWGCISEIGDLRSVIVCRPTFFEILKPINPIQKKYFELKRGPDAVKKLSQFERFVEVLRDEGVDIFEVDSSSEKPYQVFIRDVGFISRFGAVIGNLKFDIRKGEEKHVINLLKRLNIPIYYQMKNDELLECGDIFLLGDYLIVGKGERTNEKAIKSIKSIFKNYNVISVDFPGKYLHLDCIFNIVGVNIALIYREALPLKFLKFLEREGFSLINVDKEEQQQMATNVLSLSYTKVISFNKNQGINRKLRKEGIDVIDIDLSEIVKGGGGPRCMTFPVYRGV